ncbi:MAG: DapH/DapD/GlmU-related protein [Myxococcota bacterium]
MEAISSHAVVQTEASNIGAGCRIGEFAVIRPNVVLGEGVVIHPNVVIHEGVVIGDRVEVFPGAVIGRTPKGAGATARTPEFQEHVRIGDDCSIGPHSVVYYDVAIGANTLVGDGASIREQCVIGTHCIISRQVTINYNTKIGNRVKIMDLSHLTGNMVIEDDAFVSTMVGTTNDAMLRDAGLAGPTIGRFAIVAAGATLLPGTRIGAHAVVGAGAVVTKDVGEREIVMGVPGKVVRTRTV